jgi:Protein phosphatase 2C
VGEAPFFAIGDPGRAALETPDGPPPARIGPADVELSAAALPGVLIRAASIRGLQHRARRTLRQDAFALGRHAVRGQAEQAVVIVCDGVGSLDRSDYAAVLVSRRLAEYGADGMSWPDAFGYANEELYKVASAADEAGAGGMATTAVAVTVAREGGTWAGQAAWVGDSTLWHLGDDLRWSLVTGSQRRDGEEDYHSSGVRPMPTRDGSCTWCSFRIRGGALFVMTDGVGNPLLWSAEVRSALASWWTRPPDPFTFAAQVGFARKTHVDDRTVVGIWPDWNDEDASREGGPGTADPAG